MGEAAVAFRVLGDATRLRLVRVLSEGAFNVTELVSVVGVGQSSVSHHLAKLKSIELVGETRRGGYTYYHLLGGRTAACAPLIDFAKGGADTHRDLLRARQILQARAEQEHLNERLLEPGQSWRLWSRTFLSLLPRWDIADFGCGTGQLTVELAPMARKVTAIDRNARALSVLRRRIKNIADVTVEVVRADLHHLPCAAKSFDLVIASQSLHHVRNPGQVLAEAYRVLRPGGRCLVLELMPHQELWVETQLGHTHLGFAPEMLRNLMQQAGFHVAPAQLLSAEGSTPFHPYVLKGTRQ